MSHLLRGFVFPYEGLQEKVYERAFSNPVLFILGIAISLVLVVVGWILIYFANREEPLKVHLSLYAHLSRELYFPDLYKLTGEGFMKLARLLSFTSLSAVSAYGIFYAGETSENFPLDALILAFFIPLFPISLITSYLIRRFWIYSYPLVAILGLISLEFIKIPNYEFLYYLASFTLLFHSVRTLVSQSFKEGISELYPALLSLVWLSKEETHFVFLLLPSALLYLLGIYTKRVLHTDSFYYAGGFMEKMPIYSLLLVIASLQACLTPLMPSFYPFFDALLKANVLQATLLITGWFMLGVAIALSVWRLLHGLPREDINYTDLLRR
jgi:NADH-quinone oxidoreductase subunit L